MKYIVNFTLPMSCSCIVEAENAIQAAKLINRKKYADIKHLEFSVDEDEPMDEDICELCNTELMEE